MHWRQGDHGAAHGADVFSGTIAHHDAAAARLECELLEVDAHGKRVDLTAAARTGLRETVENSSQLTV